MQREILAELRTLDRLRENLDVVDIVLGFLSSGGSKAEKPLGEYIDKVLKMRRSSFSKKVIKKNLKYCTMMCMYYFYRLDNSVSCDIFFHCGKSFLWSYPGIPF